MSSHQFEEVERTCDSVLIVREGRIVEHADVATLKRAQRRLYRLQAAEPAAALSLLRGQGFEVAQVDERSLEVAVSHERIDQLIKTVAQLRLTDFESKAQTLEDIFMHYYGRQQGGA